LFWFWHGCDASRDLPLRAVIPGVWLTASKETIRMMDRIYSIGGTALTWWIDEILIAVRDIDSAETRHSGRLPHLSRVLTLESRFISYTRAGEHILPPRRRAVMNEYGDALITESSSGTTWSGDHSILNRVLSQQIQRISDTKKFLAITFEKNTATNRLE
jgi:hypothetical protein